MSRATILVTRPEPGASVTAEKLRALGFDVVVQPFTEMVPIDLPIDAGSNASAIIVTSANALRYLDEDALAPLRALPIYCVGDATKNMAERQGFQQTNSADGDGNDLIDLVRRAIAPGSPLLYLCGKTRTPDIEQQLGSDYPIGVRETYETRKISQLTEKLKIVFLENSVDALVLYSGVSAAILNKVASEDQEIQLSDNMKLFCISKRATRDLSPGFANKAIICARPTDDEMIATVDQHYRNLI